MEEQKNLEELKKERSKIKAKMRNTEKRIEHLQQNKLQELNREYEDVDIRIERLERLKRGG